MGAGLSGENPHAGFMLDRAEYRVPGDHSRASRDRRTGLREIEPRRLPRHRSRQAGSERATVEGAVRTVSRVSTEEVKAHL
jgi:ribosome biogenesis SPOUT family RNA methylase Rps3